MKAKQKNMHLKKVTEQYHQCDHLKYHHYVTINITIITLPSTSPNTTITNANGDWSVMMVFNFPPDYSKGFGGKYGVQKDRVDKVSPALTN